MKNRILTELKNAPVRIVNALETITIKQEGDYLLAFYEPRNLMTDITDSELEYLIKDYSKIEVLDVVTNTWSSL